MILLWVTVGLALVLGALMPLRWGVWGLLGAVVLLLGLQVGVRTAMGFEGASVEESLLLFNGSWATFVGWNVQVSYRALAGPLLALVVPLVWRYARR
ncbi:MAG: hypothetical protein AAF231_02740 [Pseudomonadota bacterium]